ncbi:MAG: cell division protein FtsL [Planctomycetes bacterium]|nr:cell division protein FtsL [Planctomycetota bacterium]
MKGVRVVLTVAVLANIGVLVVTQHVRATRLRYAAAQRQAELRALEQEQRTLLLRLAEARSPERLDRRAKEMGVEVKRPPAPRGGAR